MSDPHHDYSMFHHHGLFPAAYSGQPLHSPSSSSSPYTHDILTPRSSLAGSLDPATGIFYRSPEHPRLRTAQACEKCRTRKAKCSGEHPSCKRCATRGLVCEYAKEGRVRGPNKPKAKPSPPSTKISGDNPDANDTAHDPAPPQQQLQSRSVRPRPSHLRLEASARQYQDFRGPTPHKQSDPFVDMYAAETGASTSASSYPPVDADMGSGARRSCSLSESGGSVPSSAVSSTFDLSPGPSPIHTHSHSPAYPADAVSGFTGPSVGNLGMGLRVHHIGTGHLQRHLDLEHLDIGVERHVGHQQVISHAPVSVSQHHQHAHLEAHHQQERERMLHQYAIEHNADVEHRHFTTHPHQHPHDLDRLQQSTKQYTNAIQRTHQQHQQQLYPRTDALVGSLEQLSSPTSGSIHELEYDYSSWPHVQYDAQGHLYGHPHTQTQVQGQTFEVNERGGDLGMGVGLGHGHRHRLGHGHEHAPLRLESYPSADEAHEVSFSA